MTDKAELSTLSKFTESDRHAKARAGGVTYDVETISLNDLLAKYQCPRRIDYLSIDTEGSEFEILEHFDFSSYEISVITVEHNYTPKREKMFQLLSTKGFRRMFVSLSKWDDWYFKDPLPSGIVG
ncbi:MAG: hypothetical protein GWP47_02885 [Actinobacteria bacterium]|nr:hypothetical protein [Actinomycetota bacterium]